MMEQEERLTLVKEKKMWMRILFFLNCIFNKGVFNGDSYGGKN